MDKTRKELVNEFMKKYFNEPVIKKQMHWEMNGSWLTIEFYESLNAQGDNHRYSLLCAQNIIDYSTEIKGVIYLHETELLDRMHIMLFEALRSAKQDVNILLSESK